MSWPSAIGARSTSIGAPAAIVEASGFIWETNGQSVATAADGGGGSRCNKEEITACRMIRRRRCRHDSKPFLSCSRWNRPRQRACANRGRLPAPATPAAAERPPFPGQSAGTSSPESFYWHPCRKSASPLSAGRRAMHEFRAEPMIFRDILSGDPEGPSHHADCAFPARHPPEHRDDSASLRLPRRGGPYHRARRLSRYPTGTSAGPAWTISTR